MGSLSIIIPARYADRLLTDKAGGILVYGDITNTILLGRVTNPQQAFKLIDGYDSQLSRRRVIADLVDKDRFSNNKEVEDDKG